MMAPPTNKGLPHHLAAGRDESQQSAADVEAGRVPDAVTRSEQHDADSIEEDGGDRSRRTSLDHVSTHMSLGPDTAAVEQYSSFVEIPDSVYERFSPSRKLVIVTLLSFCSFLAPISSTSVLAATPEVAEEYHTDGTIINVTNAIYMLMMGISPIVWGPLSEVYGRRSVCSKPPLTVPRFMPS